MASSLGPVTVLLSSALAMGCADATPQVERCRKLTLLSASLTEELRLEVVTGPQPDVRGQLIGVELLNASDEIVYSRDLSSVDGRLTPSLAFDAQHSPELASALRSNPRVRLRYRGYSAPRPECAVPTDPIAIQRR